MGIRKQEKVFKKICELKGWKFQKYSNDGFYLLTDIEAPAMMKIILLMFISNFVIGMVVMKHSNLIFQKNCSTELVLVIILVENALSGKFRKHAILVIFLKRKITSI